MLEAGLPCAEITFRTDAALKSIEIFSRYEEFTLGAGTVLTPEQVVKAKDAGAQFMVSPGFDAAVVEYCIDREIPVIPGCCTPSEIQAAAKISISVIKFFPAEPFGGTKTLKSLSAPYPDISFIPTGGITAKNLKKYLELECVLACGIGQIVNRRAIASGDWETISNLTKEVLTIIHQE